MKHSELPLRRAITEYASKGPARFHMPGHKGFLLATDVTEVTGTDNLHSPGAAILESEMLCAEVYGAKDAFFLVNGSTAGNLAMLTLAGEGERILLGRNCHKSAINGIAVNGQETVPLFPDAQGLISAKQVDEALSASPCRAVFITSPTYRGEVSPIAEIAEAAHRHGALLLVDSAHGAHFAFSDRLPPLPLEADAYCVSCHKTLFALTQSALLLIGRNAPFTRTEVQRTLNVFQSTSPSYELMLSIESSVLEPLDWDTHVERVSKLRNILSGYHGLVMPAIDRNKNDASRLNLGFAGMTGYELASYFEARGIVPEMADCEYATLITSPADPDEWYSRLCSAISELSAEAVDADAKRFEAPRYEALSGRSVMSVRRAVFGKRRSLPLEEAVGKVSAQAVGCYPPGTALLFPGEIITRAAVNRLLLEEQRGAELFGLSDGMAETVCEDGEL